MNGLLHYPPTRAEIMNGLNSQTTKNNFNKNVQSKICTFFVSMCGNTSIKTNFAKNKSSLLLRFNSENASGI